MTVSLALRDNPRISTPTRDRIKRLATELGYHPDPELSRLMNHLRASRTAHPRTTLIDGKLIFTRKVMGRAPAPVQAPA